MPWENSWRRRFPLCTIWPLLVSCEGKGLRRQTASPGVLTTHRPPSAAAPKTARNRQNGKQINPAGG